MDEKVREVITKYLGDMHALESHGLQAVTRQEQQLKDSGHPKAVRAVQEFRQTLERHVSALEQRLKELGGSPTSPINEAAPAAAGVAAGLYNAVRTEEASKAIRDDYTFFSHSAIGYLILHTTTHSLGDRESTTLAEQGYRDSARLVMMIDHIMPGLVIAELRQDGLSPMDVQQDCLKLVWEAWQRQARSAGFSPAA